MKRTHLIASWKQEESIAHIHGWDFSHIEGRYTEETDLPWDYRGEILSRPPPRRAIRPTWICAGRSCCPWAWISVPATALIPCPTRTRPLT